MKWINRNVYAHELVLISEWDVGQCSSGQILKWCMAATV